MTIESLFRARLMAHQPLEDLVGKKIFAGRAPQNVSGPFVVWFRVSATGESALDAPISVERGRFQVDCFAEEYDAAVAIGGAVSKALLGGGNDRRLWIEKAGTFDLFEDEEPAMWRRSMDFMTAEETE